MVLCKAFPYAWAYLSPVASDLPRSRKAAGIFLQVHDVLALRPRRKRKIRLPSGDQGGVRKVRSCLRFVRDPSLRIVCKASQASCASETLLLLFGVHQLNTL